MEPIHQDRLLSLSGQVYNGAWIPRGQKQKQAGKDPQPNIKWCLGDSAEDNGEEGLKKPEGFRTTKENPHNKLT